MNIIHQEMPKPRDGNVADGILSQIILSFSEKETSSEGMIKNIMAEVRTLEIEANSLSEHSINGIFEAFTEFRDLETFFDLLFYLAEKANFPYFLTFRASSQLLLSLHKVTFLVYKKNFFLDSAKWLAIIEPVSDILLSSIENGIFQQKREQNILAKLSLQLKRTNPILATWSKKAPQFLNLRKQFFLSQRRIF
ncbi:MAG: hypothetical protein K2X39_00020 [Silvanigrellaceae bacterium]|nr:hypothetical protein [Silvanigrellaceae bacterium]